MDEEAPMDDEREIRERVRGLAAGEPVELGRLRRELGERADREGLAEVAYCELGTPFGAMVAASTARGLVFLSFPRPALDPILERLAAAISPRVVHVPARLDPARSQLDQYFEGKRTDFELQLDWQLSGGFVRDVLERTNEIPFGETRTYAEVARSAGSPRAFRAAGSALGANPIPIVVPCHRVLRTGGGLGGYGGGLEVKRRLLELEGVGGRP